ncbi:MAG: cytochrome b/b6 domain-containing protein [Erythrobacter sp.]|uniref:cytochrome b/b6 domain-containing protein n=1 Tax=Erythrobacter sp. TaxID=1042 RepID=UPI002635F306|nr:cytochrome b/b6 domain-containing protein [Erythrobacter sp.]MDJ0978038.1 cytochrome b/b6 domain-containing protein [Erythrobacter sp.]
MTLRPKPRHALSTRVWHWINAAAFVVLFMSGLGISNAHRYLYWGDYGFDPADAWTAVMRFPNWATLPQRYNLAEARDWHSAGAWVFALALLGIWVAMLANRHFARDIAAPPSAWSPANLWREVTEHLKGRFDPEDGGRYNTLQKLTYGVVFGFLLPLMILTGLAISPGFEPAAPWIVEILGGRQSARSLHFIAAFALFAFLVVHLVMVLVSGPIRQIWAMIAGGRAPEGANA